MHRTWSRPNQRLERAGEKAIKLVPRRCAQVNRWYSWSAAKPGISGIIINPHHPTNEIETCKHNREHEADPGPAHYTQWRVPEANGRVQCHRRGDDREIENQ